MEIEFKADTIRGFVREQLGLQGFETIVTQELDKIINKHRKAAVEEIQKFAFKIATNPNFQDMNVTLTIRTNEP